MASKLATGVVALIVVAGGLALFFGGTHGASSERTDRDDRTAESRTFDSPVAVSGAGTSPPGFSKANDAAPKVEVGVVWEGRAGNPAAKGSVFIAERFAGRFSDALVEATIEADGTFSVPHLPRAQYVAIARSTVSESDIGRFDVDDSGPSPRLELLLQPGVRLHGTVTDSTGRVLAGAEIVTVSGRRARSQDDGQYELRGVRLELGPIQARARGCVERRIHVGGNGTDEIELDIELARSHAVTGRVVDPNGNPVAGARLLRVETDSEGRFTAEREDRGTLPKILVRKDGYETRVIEPVPWSPDPFEFVLEPAPKVTVRGVVRTESGEGIAGAEIRIDDQPEEGDAVGLSGAGGHFELENVTLYQTRKPQVLVRSPGYAPWVHRCSIAEAEFLDVELPDGRILEGVVVDGAGEPLLGMTVRYSSGGSYPLDSWPSVSTAADGGFVFSGLPPTFGRVTAVRGDGHSVSQSVGAGQTVVTIVVDEPPQPENFGLVGRVVDDETGEPVERFRVRVEPSLQVDDSERLSMSIDQAYHGFQMQSSDGVFRIDGRFSPSRGGCRLTIESDDHLASTVDPFWQRDLQTPVEELAIYRMRRGLYVGGRVIDRWTGDPVEGATVRRVVWPYGQVRAASFQEIDRETKERALTDIRGSFRLAATHVLSELVVTSPDFAPVRISTARSKDGHRLELDRPATLRGQLVSPMFTSAEVDKLRIEIAGLSFEGVTDSAGEFEIGGLPPGVATITWVKDRQYVMVHQLELPAGETTALRMPFDDGRSISGHVTREGRPVGGVRVQLRPSGAPMASMSSTTTDDAGRYSFAGMPVVDYLIEVSGPNYQPLVPARPAPAGTDRIDLEISTRSLGGIVTDARSEPAGEVRLRVLASASNPDALSTRPEGRSSSWRLFEYTRAGEDGRYEIEGLPEGTYRLVQSRHDSGDRVSSSFDVRGASTEFDFQLDDGVTLTFEALESDRQPTPDFYWLKLYDEAGISIGSARAPNGGSCEIQDVAPGRYECLYSKIRGRVHSVWIDVPGRGESKIELSFSDGPSVRFRLADAAHVAGVAFLELDLGDVLPVSHRLDGSDTLTVIFSAEEPTEVATRHFEPGHYRLPVTILVAPGEREAETRRYLCSVVRESTVEFTVPESGEVVVDLSFWPDDESP